MSLFEKYNAFLEQYPLRPALILDKNDIEDKIDRFQKAVPGVIPYYAMKANPHPEVLKTVSNKGLDFDVASGKEIEILERLSINVRHVLFSNPIKSREDIGYAAWCGVQYFAIDSIEEMCKVQSIVPHAKMYIRLTLDKSLADSPLDDKFGMELYEINDLLSVAKTIKADVCGVTFHVGSQCRYLQAWDKALELALSVGQLLIDRGFKFELLNLGGGFPVHHTRPVPEIEDIGALIEKRLRGLPSNTRVVAEPGRFLVSEAGTLLCRVVGICMRKGVRWAFLDIGSYNGLLEATQGLEFAFLSNRTEPIARWCLAGPTCDSNDIVSRDARLPVSLQEGDFLFVPNTGAYSVVSASNFNGAYIPEVRVT